MTRLPEAALHRIWERHDLLTPHLRTVDGRRVTIINAGSPNPDSGPDFLDAIVRIGATTFRGDVEIHTSPSQWRLHGHDRDPRYNRVVLHVTGCTGGTATPPARTHAGRILPHLVLPPPHALPVTSRTARERTIDACAARIRQAPDPHRMLRRLGWARIRGRAWQFAQRLRQLPAGEQAPPADQWEQVVYEALLESMGYARNAAPFLLLARTVALADLRRGDLCERERCMGILFGVAGLLPDPVALADEEAAAFAHTLHGHWRTWRRAHTGSPAPEMPWVFFRLRPANFPTARIAAAAHLLPVLFSRNRLSALLRVVTDRRRPAHHVMRILHRLVSFTPEGYWSSHLHFSDRKKPRGVALGRDRLAIILFNALLPAAMAYARTTGDRTLARRLRRSGQHIPAPHEPRIVRDIRERTPGLTGRIRGVEQMGILELARRVQKGLPACTARVPHK